jgi:hypothetical protein
MLMDSQHCNAKMTARAEYWLPQSLGYRFLAEAKRLWELELAEAKPKLTTVHAGLLLNLVYNVNGHDKIGWTFTLRAVAIAHELALFHPSPDIKNKRLREGRDFTAWAIFSWQR